MKLFIAALPIFDTDMAVEAYRLSAQSGDMALSVKGDFRGRAEAWASPGLDTLKIVGVEAFAADKPLLVDLTRVLLIKGSPTELDIPPERLVCVLPGGLPTDDELLEKCRVLKEKGYGIALENFPLAGIDSPYFDYAKYLILKRREPRYNEIVRAMVYKRPNVRLIISEIPNADAYAAACKDHDTRRALFSGKFYSQPITRGAASVAPVKVNALQLLREITDEDFDLTAISSIVGRDPALTINLLRFINKGAKLSRKVDSIQSAVAIMGQEEVRRWGSIACSISLAEERPGELTRLSLIRAKFAENLAGAFELGVFSSSLFMAGLFSLLNVILNKPMPDAVAEVAVNEKVRKALVDCGGELYPVLELIYAYERAEWNDVSILMIRYGTDIETVSTAFIEALTWYQALLANIDSL